MMPPLGNFADIAMADIDTALEVNLSAAIALTRLVVPQMRARYRRQGGARPRPAAER